MSKGNTITKCTGKIYEDRGSIFVEMDENHPIIDLPLREGEYMSVTISNTQQMIVFVEEEGGTCGLNDLSGSVYPPQDVKWDKLGSFSLTSSPPPETYNIHWCEGCGTNKYTIWDTGIRVPRGIWWSDYT